MAIFPMISSDKCVQLCDCIRIDATRTLISNPDILANVTSVEVAPNGVDFVELRSATNLTSQREWFLDWVYEDKSDATDGVISPLLRVTATEGRVLEKSTSLLLLTEEEDKLFSCDQDLTVHEQDVLKFIPEGYCSWNHVHRRAQTLILDWLDDNGYTLQNYGKVTKANILMKDELRDWSTYVSLMLIFESQSNAVDDVFRDKAKFYESLAGRARHQYHRGIDWNSDGELSVDEHKTHEISATRLVRR